jgi:hypothetical protein
MKGVAVTKVLGTVAAGRGEDGLDETIAEKDRPHRGGSACFAAEVERA